MNKTLEQAISDFLTDSMLEKHPSVKNMTAGIVHIISTLPQSHAVSGDAAQQSGDGWEWTDALACEWAGYMESKMVYSSVQHIPQLLAQWKASKIQQPPSNP